jgi:hypothetical protein
MNGQRETDKERDDDKYSHVNGQKNIDRDEQRRTKREREREREIQSDDKYLGTDLKELGQLISKVHELSCRLTDVPNMQQSGRDN